MSDGDRLLPTFDAHVISSLDIASRCDDDVTAQAGGVSADAIEACAQECGAGTVNSVDATPADFVIAFIYLLACGVMTPSSSIARSSTRRSLNE